MTIPLLGGQLRCPICLDQFAWSEAQVFIRDQDYAMRDLTKVTEEKARDSLRRRAFLKCTNRGTMMFPTLDDHYLPLVMANHDPVILGFVGGSSSGKSHLLAAMIAEIERQRLLDFHVRAVALDQQRHSAYVRHFVEPLSRQAELPPTPEGETLFVTAYLMDSPYTGGRPRAVAFFDIAGGDLGPSSRDGRFVTGADGLFYLVDPALAFGIEGRAEERPDAPGAQDVAIANVLARMQNLAGGYSPVPASIVVVKADRFRFQPPVDRWIHEPTVPTMSLDRVRAESRDVYALLYQREARPWLQPAQIHKRCTLHFASATGCDAVTMPVPDKDGHSDRRFVRPVRSRVLEPLLAMLAMTGVIPGNGVGEG